ncbi:MAG: class I SAM-dependent methyltransferase [Polyangiaceae bacterium]
MGNAREHWDRVYETKDATEVSWYRAHLETSLALIQQAAAARSSAIIDVGGGESTLVDDLVARGYGDVTVLDVSSTAIEATRARLGEDAGKVDWICGDVTSVELPQARFDLWHDRAVFHFLTDPAGRAAYVKQVARSVRLGGHVIVGTFGPGGPLQCSGLDVVRYDAGALHDQFGGRFQLVRHLEEVHRTPLGREQQFVWCLFRLIGGSGGS